MKKIYNLYIVSNLCHRVIYWYLGKKLCWYQKNESESITGGSVHLS